MCNNRSAVAQQISKTVAELIRDWCGDEGLGFLGLRILTFKIHGFKVHGMGCCKVWGAHGESMMLLGRLVDDDWVATSSPLQYSLATRT